MTGSFNKLLRIKSRLAGITRDAQWHFCQGRIFDQKESQGRILVYHGVCLHDHLRFNTLFVNLRSFEKQLKLYKRYFNVVSLADFFDGKFSEEKFTVSLTFDDGFANNYHYVLPLLEQYEVPATFFVTGIRAAGYDILWNDFLTIAGRYGPDRFTFKSDLYYKHANRKYRSASTKMNLIDILRPAPFEDKAEIIRTLGPLHLRADGDYWMQMTRDQIRTLSASKWVTMGSHSYYHDDLAKLSPDLLEQDLRHSKKYLEDITGKEIMALAFPYGSYTKEVVKFALDAGYKQLLATEFRCPSDKNDPALRERFTINPFISNINQLYANVRGNYH